MKKNNELKFFMMALLAVAFFQSSVHAVEVEGPSKPVNVSTMSSGSTVALAEALSADLTAGDAFLEEGLTSLQADNEVYIKRILSYWHFYLEQAGGHSAALQERVDIMQGKSQDLSGDELAALKSILSAARVLSFPYILQNPEAGPFGMVAARYPETGELALLQRKVRGQLRGIFAQARLRMQARRQKRLNERAGQAAAIAAEGLDEGSSELLMPELWAETGAVGSSALQRLKTRRSVK